MAEQRKIRRPVGEELVAARAALEPLHLDEKQMERALRQFQYAVRLAALSSDHKSAAQTRATVSRLAESSMSLELSAIAQEVADEMAVRVSKSLALERTIPLTDLFLAIELASRATRNILFVPGRPTNASLHMVVPTLLPVVEQGPGEPVRIRWNKTNDRQPEAANQPMAVLLTLTRLILPETTDVSVFNIIRKVRSAMRTADTLLTKEQQTPTKFSGIKGFATDR